QSLIAFKSIAMELNKLIINETAIRNDLENNWAVVAEGIQTILRREGYPKPYEALKDFTRTNERISQKTIAAFVEGLDVSDTIREEIKAISPWNYTGV